MRRRSVRTLYHPSGVLVTDGLLVTENGNSRVLVHRP